LSAASSSSGGGKELVFVGVEAQDLPVELPLLEREAGREGERERGRERERRRKKKKLSQGLLPGLMGWALSTSPTRREKKIFFLLASSIRAKAPRMRTGTTVPVVKAFSESSTASRGSPSPLRSFAAGTEEEVGVVAAAAEAEAAYFPFPASTLASSAA
jgi:hypothetical protein